MKTNYFLMLAAGMILAFSGLGYASDAAPSPELMTKGRELFNDKKGLGVKFACILCHKQDKAVKKSQVEKAGEHLPAVINKYITEKSKGKALAPDSEEMKALIAYIKYEHSK